MAIDFRSDPVGPRIKGWIPRGQGQTKLIPGWEPRPEYGVGQDEPDPDLQAHLGGGYTPPPDPPPDPTPPPDPGLQAHLGGTPLPDPGLQAHLSGSAPPPTPAPPAPAPPTPSVAQTTPPVYTPRQTQPLSSTAPTTASGAPSPSSAPQAPSAPSAAASTKPPTSPLQNSPAQRTPTQQEFLDQMVPTAKKVSAETGIPWQVLVAIPANETGWGSAVFHNNYFGVKDPKGAPSRTWEVVNGQRVDITDNFAGYDNAEASMRGFVSFVNDNPRYKDALDYINKNPNDWPQFVNMLHQAGYATDPNWSTQVNSIGRGLESTSTDHPSTLSPGDTNPDVARGQGSLFDTAKSAIGSKYVWGGTGGRSNFDPKFAGSDCSGYVSWVYRNSLGITLPAQTQSIYAVSKPISQKDAVPGDLIMFNMDDPDPHMQHVAIYEGNGMMIHDSSLNPDGGVDETAIWSGAEFRRVSGVNADDLSKPGVDQPPAQPTPTSSTGPPAPVQGSQSPLHTGLNDLTHPTINATKPTVLSRLGGGNMGAGLGQGEDPPPWTDESGNPEDRSYPTNERKPNMLVAAPQPDDPKNLTPKLDGGDVYPWTAGVGPPRHYMGDPRAADVGGPPDPGTTQSWTQGQPEVNIDDDSLPYMPSRMPNYVPQPQDPNAPIKVGTGQEQAKPTMSKKDASYTKKAQEDNCADCSMFSANTCSLVKGYIHPGGTCDYYEPKKAAVGAGQDDGSDDTSTDDNKPWWQKAQDAAGNVVQGAQTLASNAVTALTTNDRTPNPGIPGQPQIAFPAAPEPAKPPQLETTPEMNQPPPEARTAQQVADSGGGPMFIGNDDTPLPPPTPTPSPQSQRQSLIAPSDDPSQPQLTPPAQPDQPQFVPGTNRIPTLPQGSPLTQSGPTNPMDKDTAVGQALASTVVPDEVANKGVDTPIGRFTVHDAAAQALRPSTLANAVTGPASAAEAGVKALGGLNLPEQVITQGLEAGGKKLAGAAGAALERVAPALGKAGAAATEQGAKALVQAGKPLANTPFARFVTEDAATATVGGMLQVAKGPVVGGAMGAVGGAALGVESDLTHGVNPQSDPNWWSDIVTDAANNAKFGAGVGVGLGVVGPMAKFGWDHTLSKPVMAAWRTAFEPMKNIPSQGAQATLGERADAINKAFAASQLLQWDGQRMFGKAGTGVNTAEAAAYLEQYRTLRGFVDPRTGGVPTSEQIKWSEDRVSYEDITGAYMRNIGALSPTQDVTTPLWEEGPSAHVMHLYEDGVGGVKESKKKSGVGWSDTVTHKRMAGGSTTNPDLPRTLRQAIDMHRSNAIDNPEPLDDLVSRFSTSFYQSERAVANREAWVSLRNDPTAVHHAVPGGASTPDGWKPPVDQWGMGHGQDQYRVEPNLATYLNNITSKSVLRETPILREIMTMSQPLKMMAFSGSPTHLANVVWRAHSVMASHGVLGGGIGELAKGWILPTFRPGGKTALFLGNADKVERAAAAGVTLGHFGDDMMSKYAGINGAAQVQKLVGAGLGSASVGWLDAKRRGASDAEAWDEAWKYGLIGSVPFMPGAGAVSQGVAKVMGQDVSHAALMSSADLIHDAIFYQALPAAKVGLFDILTRGNPSANEKLVGELVNNTLGGIDLIKLGRSPAVQDLLRFSLVSSDFEEGEVQTAWNAFAPDARGAFTRRTAVSGLASVYGTTALLNLALNGHFPWDNGRGHEYELETTGGLDRLADLTGQSWMRATDPVTQRPQRQYIDPMPPLRWMMQTIGEGSRQLADTFAQSEQTFGTDPSMRASGQRLQSQIEGDPTQGDMPPDVQGAVRQDAQNRLGFGINMIGGALGMLSGDKPRDYQGHSYDLPGASPQAPWSSVATRAASIAAIDAPSGVLSALNKLNVEHPSRGRALDAILAGTSISRTYAASAVSDALVAQDNIRKHYGIDPAQQESLDQQYAAGIKQNDDAKAKVFSDAPTSTENHAALDKRLADVSQQRKPFSRRQALDREFAQAIPDEGTRNKVIDFLTNVWDPKGMASPVPADTDPSIDAPKMLSAWQKPEGVDPNDKVALAKARSDVLKDMAERTGSNPDALEDAFKWIQSNTDPNTGQVKAMPVLPGVTSDDLAKYTTGFLDAGVDPQNRATTIQDPAVRAETQRQYLDDTAAAIGVKPDVLLQRINLRLQGADPPTGLEKSYNSALQTYFESRDPEKFPQYMNEDGSAMGTPDDWNKKGGWNDQLGAAPAANKKYDPKYFPLAEAKKRADDARTKFLLNNPNNGDYERWFGLGRDMSESDWAKYSTGNTIGYADLQGASGIGAPKNETIKRDKILKLYDASTVQERIEGPEVTLWIEGSPQRMNLAGAYQYLHNPYVRLNTAGRTLANATASDDDGSDQGVQ